MAEPALRDDVIKALQNEKSLSVKVMQDGSVEVAFGDNVRRFPFDAVVSRAMLWKLHHWYNVPMAAFFPPESFKPQTKVSGAADGRDKK